MSRKHASEVEKALRRLCVGQSLAVSEPQLVNLGDAGLELRSEVLVLGPGEAPPLGTVWTVYGPMTAEQEALAVAGAADTDEEFRDRVARHFARRPAPQATALDPCPGCGLGGDRHTATCPVDDDGYHEFP